VAVIKNLKILQRVQNESGAKVLLALKAFSMFSLAPIISQYLSGTCASGLHEARLGYEEYGGNLLGEDKREVHVFSAAYTEDDLDQLLGFSDHVIFNSLQQWNRFRRLTQEAKTQYPQLEFGLRINPMHSEGAMPIYDPCAAGSRLGITLEEFTRLAPSIDDIEGISGLNFLTLCEQGFQPLARTQDSIEIQFADYLPYMSWINFGGYHITQADYDVDGLIERIKQFQHKYQLQVYLEPGEAIAIHTGILVSEVLDLVSNDKTLAILDTSATCHMPDVIEMPYRPEVFLAAADGGECAAESGDKLHSYGLGVQTCLAGDVMGDYSFDHPLHIGQRLMFDDMRHYTMVKTTTFNGIGLPSIAVWNSVTGTLVMVKEFGYQDFRNRLS
jgi:carboxynorspermidine decarboxylase